MFWLNILVSCFCVLHSIHFEGLDGKGGIYNLQIIDPNKVIFKKVVPLTSQKLYNNESNENEIFPANFSLLNEHKDSLPINHVFDQQECGGSWAFSSMDTAGSWVSNVTRNDQLRINLVMSPLHELNCNTRSGSNLGKQLYSKGCDGGHLILSFLNIIQSGTVADECQKFDGNTTNCSRRCDDGRRAHIFTPHEAHYHAYFIEFDEYGEFEKNWMRVLMNFGPASVTMNAYPSLSEYKGGIYRKEKSERNFVLHAVTLYGWGEQLENTTNGEQMTKYWLIKNSWGAEFGEKGFFKIPRGVDECHIEKNGLYYFQRPPPKKIAPPPMPTLEMYDTDGSYQNRKKTQNESKVPSAVIVLAALSGSFAVASLVALIVGRIAIFRAEKQKKRRQMMRTLPQFNWSIPESALTATKKSQWNGTDSKEVSKAKTISSQPDDEIEENDDDISGGNRDASDNEESSSEENEMKKPLFSDHYT
ncbi:putative Cathepsin B-like cysteine proteinase [Monocercomonoides exilis]|uniref:putative Cathepsin B-like cysteine proteinase n=1 Tax=Monocercomonoides exilis TaxID=2049356 RepID=UPI003559D928|nr:putative Cathepsin B-like cysteine proteinase [Monocercomonoides exilis]|eukprot:MONOS_7750.1-p1 / transcript=MONOS_7750.1 / gene=MONOS_7750 / organism=Monocercomonoides_exilis_PA203 / gene_product=Cathepsin B-like cysteine proteinase / transcript_product=Cathepsin B-like cysteine proteinase / location=Mono_scaffold00273:35025-36859(+) / protein_length=474 / sequence_SO=supercontig / SO=protein_coding / is_pseudo=false